MKFRTRIAGALFAALMLTLALAGTASAREITSGGGGGGGGGGTTTCNPVTSLKAKGDTTTSDVRVATLSVDYSVKSCDGGAVTVTTQVYKYADPTQVAWFDPAAPLSGRFTAGVDVRTTYIVKVSVFDAVTGAPEGSLSISAAAIPKTGV